MTMNGTVALVTGGAKRVGRAIVLQLAEAGCHVAIHYRRSRAEAEALGADVEKLGRRALIVGADLSDPKSWPQIITEVVDAFQRLDVLINNASAFLTDRPDTLDAFDPDLWEAMLRLNLVAPAGLCHHAQPYLKAGGRGHVVNLCDVASDPPHPKHLAYGTSKAALAALTRGLARALAPEVRVNGIAPGIAVFPDEYSAEQRRKLISKVPLGRAGTPEDVAGLVRFLIESGDYITGQVIPVDGGRGLH